MEEGVHLDFGAVEFAYIGALGRALLLLDAAVREGIPASVVLPTGGFPQGDPAGNGEQVPETFERHVARQARLRAQARTFMHDVGFVAALRPAHWPDGAVIVTDGPGNRNDAGRGVGEPVNVESEPFRRRRILPFHWVHHEYGIGSGLQHALTSATRRLSDMGLSAADSRAVAHVMMTELVDNVHYHAAAGETTPRHALVASVLVDGRLYVSRRDELPQLAGRLTESLGNNGGRRVLEVFVGDSGRGFVDRGRGDIHEAILSSFERMPAAHEATRRDASGLWKVAHLVRGYRGAVTVSTAGRSAGKVYTAGDLVDVADDFPAVGRGAVVEATLVLERPSAKNVTAPWRSRTRTGDAVRLSVIACAFDSETGLSDVDWEHLHSQARLTETGQGVEGVVVTIPIRGSGVRLSDGAMQAVLARVLDAAGAIQRRISVTVVFPDTDPRILDLSVAGINAEEDRCLEPGDLGSDPILVMGSAAVPLWCGGARWTREVLESLTSAREAVPLEALEQIWAGQPGAAQRLAKVLRHHPHLVSVATGQAALTVSPEDAVRALRQAVHARLRKEVEEGGAGVNVGHFLGPALRRTGRWIEARRLIEETVGASLAGWLLARAFEVEWDAVGAVDQPMSVARFGGAMESIVRQVSECLSVGARIYAMPAELDLDGVPVSEQVPRGARVVLCSEILSTENTSRRAAAAVVSRDAVPVAILCVADTRSERGPVQIFNRDIPVLALTEADTEPVGESGPPVGIDPLLLKPVNDTSAPTDADPVDQETLLEWCAKGVDWLRLGHFESMRRTRHFSAYLQLERLVSVSAIAERLREAVRSTIHSVATEWREGGERLASVELWYPGSADSVAGRFVTLVSDALREDGRQVSAVRPIPRAVAGTRWAFPDRLDLGSRPGTVIVVDWGALSSASVQQMLRVAAESGATAVLALIMLNQLDEQDAGALRAISALHIRQWGDGIPAQVRFLATSSLGGVSRRNCSLCDIGEFVNNNIEEIPPALRPHAEQLRDRTRLRAGEKPFGSPATDVFNVPINGHDLADYLRWRGLLLRAMRVTAARQEVIDKLRVLTDGGVVGDGPTHWTRNNLLRLVAAEQQWLKLPPLRYAVGRELLARMCTTVLREPPTTMAWLRMQAVMVLAASEPSQLARILPGLIARTVDEPVMINQLLLECYRQLRRPLLDSPVDPQEMHRSLVQCRDRLELLLYDHDPAAVKKYLRVLKHLLALLKGRMRAIPRDAQETWGLLREDFKRYVETHSMEAMLLRVRDFVEDLQVAPPAEKRTGEALADWDTCSTQLGERVIGHLSGLTDILAGDYVSDRIGEQEQRRLLAVVNSQGVNELQGVLERLHAITGRAWEPGSPDWRAKRSELLEELRWWHRTFMTPHADSGKAALVVDLIGSVPASPFETVTRVLGSRLPGLSVLKAPDAVDRRMFCPAPLLDTVLAHLRDNITHHAVRGAVQRVEVEYRLVEGMMEIVVRNSGTRPSPRPGRGLPALNDKARPFGGSVTGRPEVGGRWTFTSTVAFPLWRGA
ncbi:hypothetical protein GCM10009634_86290 [Saccharothrix xinjiangensis]